MFIAGNPPLNVTEIGSAVPPPAYEKSTVSRSLAVRGAGDLDLDSLVQRNLLDDRRVRVVEELKVGDAPDLSTRRVRFEPVDGAV